MAQGGGWRRQIVDAAGAIAVGSAISAGSRQDQVAQRAALAARRDGVQGRSAQVRLGRQPGRRRDRRRRQGRATEYGRRSAAIRRRRRRPRDVQLGVARPARRLRPAFTQTLGRYIAPARRFSRSTHRCGRFLYLSHPHTAWVMKKQFYQTALGNCYASKLTKY